MLSASRSSSNSGASGRRSLSLMQPRFMFDQQRLASIVATCSGSGRRPQAAAWTGRNTLTCLVRYRWKSSGFRGECHGQDERTVKEGTTFIRSPRPVLLTLAPTSAPVGLPPLPPALERAPFPPLPPTGGRPAKKPHFTPDARSTDHAKMAMFLNMRCVGWSYTLDVSSGIGFIRTNQPLDETILVFKILASSLFQIEKTKFH
jgi:hypothetical protein